MRLEQRIEVLSDLGKDIDKGGEWLDKAIQEAYFHNKWFTKESSKNALKAIRNSFLSDKILRSWTDGYGIATDGNPRNVGLILAGNIPLVGFHDVMCCFVQGHRSMIKLSSKDQALIKALVNQMNERAPESVEYFQFVEKLHGFDAVIATGSNNSSRYFESYFGKYPSIIRKSRNAVAVLDGSESVDDLMRLGHDIFQYFGLGCRNVSKIYIPRDYKLEELIEVLHEGFKDYANHNKYKNNYDYNYALFMLNKEEFLISGSLIFKEAKEIASRIACLHYERYDSIENLETELNQSLESIQCISSNMTLGLDTVRLGQAQKPSISDYADGVDTMEFFKSIA